MVVATPPGPMPIQTEPCPHGFDGVGAHLRVEFHLREKVAGSKLHHDERKERNPQEDRDHMEKPFEDELGHNTALPLLG